MKARFGTDSTILIILMFSILSQGKFGEIHNANPPFSTVMVVLFPNVLSCLGLVEKLFHTAVRL